MSKNMTRKGLAFGAGASLLAASFVGLPAQASDQTLTMSPSAGVGFNTLNTSKFTLTTVVSGTTEYSALRYRIINEDEKFVTFEMKRGATAGANTAHATGVADGVAGKVGYQTLSVTGAGYVTATDVLTLTVANNLIQVGQEVTITSLIGTVDATAVGADADAQAEWDKVKAAVNGETFTTIAGTDGTNIVIDLGAGGTADRNFAAADFDAADGGVVPTATATSDNASSETTRSSDFVVEPQTGTNDAESGTPTTLELSVSDYSATSTISVQAFVDSNGDNKLTAGEKYSAVQELNFYEPTGITASVAFSPVLIDDAALVANVTFSNGINVRQIDANLVRVEFKGPTSAYADLGGQDNSAPAASWNSVAGAYRASLGGDLNAGGAGTAVLAGAAYKAVVLLKTDPGQTTYTEGQFATTSVGTALAASNTLVSRVVNASNALSSAAAVVDADADAAETFGAAGAGTGKIRVDGVDAATAQVQLFVGTDAEKPAGVASRPVEVTVTSTNITATDKVVVGGQDVVTSAGASSFVVTTGADGYATFTVDPGAADNNDTIIVNAKSGGQNFAQLTITLTEGTYTLSEVATGARAITAGGSVTFNYQVVDEFGVAPKNNTHSVVVTDLANENRTKNADFTYTAQIVDGKASVTVVDNGTGTGTLRVNSQLMLGTATSGNPITNVVNIVADATVATLTAATPTYGTSQYNPAASPVVDNRTKLIVSTATFADFDSRFATPGATAPAVTDVTKVVVGATAKNAAGTALVGVPVTFAAQGFLFQSGTRYAKDTITVMSGGSGLASVTVWSNVGGAQTIAITSGAATASQALTYAGGTATAASFTVTAPATSEAGKTADVVVSVKDKFGNPASGVAVTLYSTGPGYLINTTGTTLSNGTFSTKLLIGSNDSGTAVVTAVISIAGVETIQTASIVVGAAAEEKKVNAGSFKGYVALYAKGYAGQRMSAKVGNDWVVVPVLASNFERVVEFTGAGFTINVPIYIDRVLVDTITVTTK